MGLISLSLSLFLSTCLPRNCCSAPSAPWMSTTRRLHWAAAARSASTTSARTASSQPPSSWTSPSWSASTPASPSPPSLPLLPLAVRASYLRNPGVPRCAYSEVLGLTSSRPLHCSAPTTHLCPLASQIELFTRVEFAVLPASADAASAAYEPFHPLMGSILGFLLKAPQTAPGIPVVNRSAPRPLLPLCMMWYITGHVSSTPALDTSNHSLPPSVCSLFKQRLCLENILRCCAGLEPVNMMSLLVVEEMKRAGASLSRTGTQRRSYSRHHRCCWCGLLRRSRAQHCRSQHCGAAAQQELSTPARRLVCKMPPCPDVG